MPPRRRTRSGNGFAVAKDIPLPPSPKFKAQLSVEDDWPTSHANPSEDRDRKPKCPYHVKLNRSSQWAPHPTGSDLKNYMKFVTWDTGLQAFPDTVNGRAQARITVYLIEKFEEICGKGSSRSDFLCCMVKTRQWQDAQVVSKTDNRPWKAYYRVLGQLDLQRDASEEAHGYQQKSVSG